MRIKQAYVSPSLSQFKNEFLECWNLDDYNNIEEPTVFYGLYYDWDGDKKWMKDTSRDIEIFNNHNGLKVLLCGGIEYNSGVFDKIDNYKLICVDDVESHIANKVGLEYISLKIPYFDFDKYKPTPLGDKIYSHIPMRENDGKWGKSFENMFQYEKLMKLFGEDTFCFPKEWVTPQECIPYFNQSFVNIKPNRIRGFVTSWKLGCLGRNTITTNREDAPNFIHYSNDDELKRFVDEEFKKIGTIQENKLWDYFHQSDDWLHEDYWK
jgi:hypothetical protein|tara:strand:+ start:745 stop:1542 length:798 start_codon:yes stop_codon:yes gene_type:complete